MTDDDLPPRYNRLTFHGPLSDARAAFRPEWIEAASPEEWDDFESGVAADVEEWLAGHPDHPQAAETRKRADDRLSVWLRGSRGCLGQAYLTLIPMP